MRKPAVQKQIIKNIEMRKPALQKQISFSPLIAAKKKDIDGDISQSKEISVDNSARENAATNKHNQ